MQLSESTNKTGIYELFQDLTKTNPTSYSLYKFVRDANNAFGNYNLIALRSSQKWEMDDTNQTDYPIITINIVSGQADYPFTFDGSSTPNQILDISRVELKDLTGVSRFLTPYDQSETSNSLTQDATMLGTPYRYDKLANAIWLNPVPNYSLANALKVYFGRTPVYFIGDGAHNTIIPGIPDMFHPYFSYVPAYLYCVQNLPELAAGYLAIVQKMEVDIANFYFFRNRDERKNMRPLSDSSR